MTIGSISAGAAGNKVQAQPLPDVMSRGPGPEGMIGGRPFGPHTHHHSAQRVGESRTDFSANRGQWKGHCGGSENRPISTPEKNMPRGKPSEYKQPGGTSNTEKGGTQDARLKSITDFVGQVGAKLEKMFSSMKSKLESFAKNKTSDAKQDSFFKNMAGQFDKLGQMVAKFKPAESAAGTKPAAGADKPADKPLTGYSDFQRSIGNFGDTMQKFFTGLMGQKTDDKAV